MNKLIRNFCCFGSKYFLTDENRKDDLGRRKKDDRDNVSNIKSECKVKDKLELDKNEIMESCDKKSRQPAKTDTNNQYNKVGPILRQINTYL